MLRWQLVATSSVLLLMSPNESTAPVSLLARIDHGNCAVLMTSGDELRPVASLSKLFVVDATLAAVDEGRIDLDGSLQATVIVHNSPVLSSTGGRSTVRGSISAALFESDNTAVDLLVNAVGRSRVEARARALQPAHPTANMPFLSTAEATILKWVRPSIGDAYVASDIAERRRILDTIDSLSPATSRLPSKLAPRPSLGWFASPSEICAVMSSLRERRSFAGLLPRDSDGDVTYHKGGSEPGVDAVVWYLERNQRAFALVDIGSGARSAPSSSGRLRPYWQGLCRQLAYADSVCRR